MTAPLELTDVSLSYAGQTVVEDISFGVEAGQIACLLGPSGSGKTSIQRMIAGFVRPDRGSIMIDGQTVASDQQHWPPEQRRVGMVFQDYALFPHLNVRDNIAFGLHGRAADVIDGRVAAMLSLCRLDGYASRYPHQLSGGQQQRVALARALAPQPAVMLLDEPFSGTDADLRQQLCSEIRDWLKQEGTTTILVTHDQAEAFAMADVIGLIGEHRLQQWSLPHALYERPATPFAAAFIGRGQLISAQTNDAGEVVCALGKVRREPDRVESSSGRYSVLVRPEHLRISDQSPYRCTIDQIRYQGGTYQLRVILPSGEGVDMLSNDSTLVPGDTVSVALTDLPLMLYPE